MIKEKRGFSARNKKAVDPNLILLELVSSKRK